MAHPLRPEGHYTNASVQALQSMQHLPVLAYVQPLDEYQIDNSRLSLSETEPSRKWRIELWLRPYLRYKPVFETWLTVSWYNDDRFGVSKHVDHFFDIGASHGHTLGRICSQPRLTSNSIPSVTWVGAIPPKMTFVKERFIARHWKYEVDSTRV